MYIVYLPADSNSVICMKIFNVVFLKTIETPLMHFYHSTDDMVILKLRFRVRVRVRVELAYFKDLCDDNAHLN